MDTTKWRQVLVPVEVYHQLVTMAQIEERTISGQFRVIFNQWMDKNLSKADKKMLLEETEMLVDREIIRRASL
jgi:hypothetical protein|tara:strand:+ start:612 stop:830 length:219 start_codon:yes stop_codon:yes gene_type:complete